jgi:TRAP-type C4-dicarboxylate transport system permease small subunit
VLWSLWGLFFAAILMLGVLATYAQRHQTTSVDWLPAWAVALSLPIGSGLVLWRTVQNVVDLWRGEPGAAASDDPGRAGEEA